MQLDVNIMSPQRRCNVMTLHRRLGDVIFTSYACRALSDLRITALALLFFTLERSDENSSIRYCLYSSYCSTFISESKTDVFRQGQTVVIART